MYSTLVITHHPTQAPSPKMMISKNNRREEQFSNKKQQTMVKSNHLKLFLVLIVNFLLIINHIELTQSLHNELQTNGEQQTGTTTTTTNSRATNGLCLKAWVSLGQKCYKIHHSPRNHENAKGRCHDFSARLATIEDESTSEKEATTSSTSSNIIEYLISDQRKTDFQSRQYYVNLTAELLKQHQILLEHYRLNKDPYEHLDSEVTISDLWLPRDDPSLANITTSYPDLHDANYAFVLAYSKHLKKWGIVSVAPTRKMSFICERQAGSLAVQNQTAATQTSQASPNQHQIVEAKRANDLNTQRSSIHISYSQDSSFSPNSQTDNKRQLQEKEVATTPPPDTSSVLFREWPQDNSIVLGSTAEMRCSPLENESILSWTFNGKNLTQSNRVKSFPSGTLRIEHVRNTDDGNYTCTIHSGGITESKSARLEIIERPHQPEYITAELLDKLSTSVRIKWTPGFNGNSPIKKYTVEMRTVNSDNIENEMNSIMQSNLWEVAKANISADQTSVIIPDLKPARKYIFRIKATNRVGTGDPSLPTKHPIEVPVQAPSMPPENLTGSPRSSTSICLQWQPPPVDSQNGALKGYKIRHKLAGYASDSDWYISDVSDAAHLTYILDDLIVWQNYEIQVAAENDKGSGPFSSSIFIRTKEGRPDKGPRSVKAEALGPTSIKVDWTPPPPQHINGLNQGYKVQVWLDAQQTQVARELVVPHNTASPFHSISIDGLLPYTDYHISIKCYTSAGDGPTNEDPVVVKTKQDFPEAVPVLEFADILDKSLRVLWKPPKRINGELDHYTLEYSETLTPEKKNLKTYPASTTDARIIDLTPQTSYTFKIYPHTNVGQGPGKANETKTSVPPVLPEPPTNLIYSNVGSHSVNIQFTPGFDGNASIEKWIAEALTPYRGDVHAPRWQNVYVSLNHSHDTNSLVVRNLRPHTKYMIRLRPVNVVGPSIAASEPTMEFQTAQVEPEQPPRDLTIEDLKSNSAIARWSPLANNLWLGNPRGYNITWSEINNSTIMHFLITDTRADSYQIHDLEEFTEYSFRIYAVNEAGQSPPSEPVVITTLEDVPSSGPTNLTAHALSSNAVSVDWNTVPKRHRNGIIRGYKIQYQAQKSDAPLQHKTIEDNTTRHITINDLKAFTTYHLAVAAYTSAGDGVYSTVLNVQTLEDTPGKPQNLSAPTVSQTSLRILWDPPEDPNGDIIGYKVAYQTLSDGGKEVASHELHSNERTFKATNLKQDTHYVFTVTAKTKEGWGQQASILLYTYDSELRANLPFFRESWFVILCACLSFVITIIVTALLFIQTKSYKYKQEGIKSTSQDKLGEAGFTIDDDDGNHYNNNGFGLLSHTAHHRRSNGAISQSTANFTLPKSPPRPNPGSVVYSDEGDDDVFEDIVDKPMKGSTAGVSNYDDSTSGDSLTEKPSEISSSPAPESESADDDYANMANKHFVNHYANVNGTLRSQKSWKKGPKHYASHRTKPKLPQRPAPSVPKVPGEPSSSSSETIVHPVPGTSGFQPPRSQANSVYGESSGVSKSQISQVNTRPPVSSNQYNGTHTDDLNNNNNNSENTQQADLLNSHIVNLNGGRIIVDNMAGSRAPLPGFTSFV